MNEGLAREEICRIGRSLFERGFVHATAGNISVRLDDGGYLITPTDACLGFLSPDRLARLDASGTQSSGDRASKTITLHRRIYAASAGTALPARCVIHTHSTHCVALTLDEDVDAVEGDCKELLPALTPYFVMKVGRVPLIDYTRPGHSGAADRVEFAIRAYATKGSPIRAVMLSRLGPNVWHDTLSAAMGTLEELEETSRLWILSGRRARALSDPQIADIRLAFGAHW
ncbi:Ribulose-5-phosphate 4-epimerase/Fuculose-1-phosphate aldolase [Variovorax sp. YR750]|uniref:class II aldolase/adducin family protein n=1 Tax=Variovorax sp. YR750 TaxID=1884384 RepID=UPI0008C7C976|nr:aldolase [Variovorax sp. YR750]SEM36536.1 Ribulose-5-phosphate 4-epimerase/Fuculose-1-phosphate aldolase [Variovorax sp. YR750]